MAKIINNAAMGLVDPIARLKQLNEYGNMIDVDPKVPITRYYRSGTEMLRMADVYSHEGHHENAFILFMKYMTLFLHKIRKHPEFNTIKDDVRNLCQEIQNRILPLTEELREKLHERYKQEYVEFLAKKEAEKAKELENDRKRLKLDTSMQGVSIAIPKGLHVKVDRTMQPTAPDMTLLDKVVYPNEFPSSAKRPRSEGLLYPDADVEMKEAGNQAPYFDRNLKPLYESTSLLAGSLREIVVPTNTMDEFLKLAAENTLRNTETCGILAGHLNQNHLYVSHVIVPKQEGTPDSCTTMNEEEIFTFQDKLDLITLGWIHTHPSQTAFLSSVDMHTQCAYQMMMPEAIAIVCAPKYNTNGFFMLTPNYGLNVIAKCRATGFHPHPNEPDPIFVTAPHITMNKFEQIEVFDLRR